MFGLQTEESYFKRVNHYFYVIPDRGTTANLNS